MRLPGLLVQIDAPILYRIEIDGGQIYYHQYHMPPHGMMGLVLLVCDGLLNNKRKTFLLSPLFILQLDFYWF